MKTKEIKTKNRVVIGHNTIIKLNAKEKNIKYIVVLARHYEDTKKEVTNN